MGQHPVIVNRWVAKVGADRINTVSLYCLCQRIRGEIKRLGPLDFNVFIMTRLRSYSLKGFAQSIRVLMDIFECYRLRADMPPTQGVVLITANVDNCIALCLDHKAAHGFAQVADTVVSGDLWFSHTSCDSISAYY